MCRYKALSDELYKNQGKANYTATFQNKVTDFYKKEFSAVDTLNSNSKDVLQKSSSRDLQNKTYNAPYRKSDKNFESANNTLNSCDTSVLLKSGPHVSNMTIPSHKMSVQPHLPLNNYHSHRNYHFQQPCNKSFVLLDVNKVNIVDVLKRQKTNFTSSLCACRNNVAIIISQMLL
jgi:hypothetical protein